MLQSVISDGPELESGEGDELEFADIVLFDGLYCASVFGPACALAREHRAANAAKEEEKMRIIMMDLVYNDRVVSSFSVT